VCVEIVTETFGIGPYFVTRTTSYLFPSRCDRTRLSFRCNLSVVMVLLRKVYHSVGLGLRSWRGVDSQWSSPSRDGVSLCFDYFDSCGLCSRISGDCSKGNPNQRWGSSRSPGFGKDGTMKIIALLVTLSLRIVMWNLIFFLFFNASFQVCFDKTGTLTEGNFQLLHLHVIGKTRTRKQVLEFLSLMEERASHPLAQAICTGARNEGISIPKALLVTDHTYLPGEGVSGVVDGSVVHVGNFRLFRRLGLLQALSENDKNAAESWERDGGTVGFMSIDGFGIVCSYCVADAVRPEAAEVVNKLNGMGLRVIMLTGDNYNAANTIGVQVGLSREEIKSQLLPEEKLSIVTGMKDWREGGQSIFANPFVSKNLVLMCGDGVNDAPALAIADVGVAMGAGAALAMETAVSSQFILPFRPCPMYILHLLFDAVLLHVGCNFIGFALVQTRRQYHYGTSCYPKD
jgi:soluble P-type ATPase